MGRQWLWLSVAGLMAGCSGAGTDAPQNAASGCPVPQPLTAPAVELDAAMQCSDNLAGSDRAPVLLVPGTATTPETAFSWSYVPALEALAWPYCTVELPDSAMADAQLSAEYIVHAVRSMADISGRRVAVVGYSQGGMLPRWAIKYYPDVRAQIEELVAFSPSNHGTETAAPTCVSGCQPSIAQQQIGSDFLTALNAGAETDPAIDYTVVYTNLDEIVVPNTGPNPSSALRDDGAHILNVATQDICPLNAADHLAIGTYDPVAYAVMVDALTNPGPAKLERLDGFSDIPGTASVCSAVFMPGVDPATFATDYTALVAGITNAIASSERVSEEPPLRCFAQDDVAG